MEVGLEAWGMVRGEPAAGTALGRSQMGMDKGKRCGRTTMGQKAGASRMMRLRWENLGKEELQYVSVSMWRVSPPQRSCPVWTGPKYLAWSRSLFLDAGGCGATASLVAVIRAFSLHRNCLQITSLPPQTCPPPPAVF